VHVEGKIRERGDEAGNIIKKNSKEVVKKTV